MITKEQLHSIYYKSEDGTNYTEPGDWEYEFNIKTQELWSINDGYGEPEFLCRVTNFEELKNIINLKP